MILNTVNFFFNIQNYYFLQYPVSTMMYSSVSSHEMCRLWHEARAGTFRGPRGRCSWCRDRRSLRCRRAGGERSESYRLRHIEHPNFDEQIHCVDRHLCCQDSESVSEFSIESESRNPSIKRNSKKKVTYQTKAEVISN